MTICKICGDEFECSSMELYQKHMRKHSTYKENRHKQSTNETVHVEKVTLCCLQCGEEFDSKKCLKRHLQVGDCKAWSPKEIQ